MELEFAKIGGRKLHCCCCRQYSRKYLPIPEIRTTLVLISHSFRFGCERPVEIMREVRNGLVLAGVILGGMSTALLIGCLVVYVIAFLKQQKYLKNVTELYSLHEQGILAVVQRKISRRLNSMILKKWESKRSTIKMMGPPQTQQAAEKSDPTPIQQQHSGTDKSSQNPEDFYIEMGLLDRVDKEVIEQAQVDQQQSKEIPQESDQEENPYFEFGLSDRIQGTLPPASK